MLRVALLIAALLLAAAGYAPAAQAITPPEIRLLQSDDPDDWERAVKIILPDDRRSVPSLSVSALTERLTDLQPKTQLRVMRKMGYALERDARVVAAFRQLAVSAEPEVMQEAQRALDRYERGKAINPTEQTTQSTAPPWYQAYLPSLALLLVLAPLALGAALFLWGWRLLQLRRLLIHLPVSRIRTLTPGLVALRGEVQSCGEPLIHPDSGEHCVYYVGAERQNEGMRFWLADDSGRVLVDPAGMVMLSADGILSPGEAVHVIASAASVGEASGPERWLLRKAQSPRTAFERLVHFLVGRLFGFFSGSELSKMLFSDPRRCFWIWDDAEGEPFGHRRETALTVAAFISAGVWIAVAAMAGSALLDRDLGILFFWQ